MKLEKASKSKSYMRVALQGASGSGKTYSALRLAFGLTREHNIAIVDTENGSAHLYSSLGDYHVLQLSAPYSPERYMEAIDVCIANGVHTIGMMLNQNLTNEEARSIAEYLRTL